MNLIDLKRSPIPYIQVEVVVCNERQNKHYDWSSGYERDTWLGPQII